MTFSSSQLSAWRHDEPLILASGSATRKDLLNSAALYPEIWPASVDERRLEASITETGGDRISIARELACAKALVVSVERPACYVIGADQTLALDGTGLHKPADRVAAHETLMRLSGRAHQLHSAVALAFNGKIVWAHVETAHLHVRVLEATFIDTYLQLTGNKVLSSVGAYQCEGTGIHLFDRIEGDHSTILGLPLLPLLAELRRRQLVIA